MSGSSLDAECTAGRGRAARTRRAGRGPRRNWESRAAGRRRRPHRAAAGQVGTCDEPGECDAEDDRSPSSTPKHQQARRDHELQRACPPEDLPGIASTRRRARRDKTRGSWEAPRRRRPPGMTSERGGRWPAPLLMTCSRSRSSSSRVRSSSSPSSCVLDLRAAPATSSGGRPSFAGDPRDEGIFGLLRPLGVELLTLVGEQKRHEALGVPRGCPCSRAR